MIAAVAYMRCSTLEQTKGDSLEAQRDAIVAWAERDGRRVVGWFWDAGKSGSNGIEKRLGLGDALDALRDDPAKPTELVVAELTRLSRDLMVQEFLLADVRRLGARLRSTRDEEDRVLEEGSEDEDASRVLIRQVLGAIAEYERKVIRLRLVRGRRHKNERGGYIGGGVGYGVQVVDDELVPDPATWPILERIADLHDRGLSYAKIADELNETGNLGPDGIHWWAARSVSRAHARFKRVAKLRR